MVLWFLAIFSCFKVSLKNALSFITRNQYFWKFACQIELTNSARAMPDILMCSCDSSTFTEFEQSSHFNIAHICKCVLLRSYHVLLIRVVRQAVNCRTGLVRHTVIHEIIRLDA